MLNLTLFSLQTLSYLSTSPLFSQNKQYSSVSFSILNSHFSHSFTNILFSIANNRNIIKSSTFTHSLNSAIYFSKIENIQEEILINNKIFSQTVIYNNTSLFGYLLLGNCIMSYCQANYGAGLYINLDFIVKIHGCIFRYCMALNGAGGYICRDRNVDNNLNLNSQLRNTTIQYCCFYQCVAEDVGYGYGYGSDLIIASKQVTMFLSSTLYHANFDKISRGAQFEILSGNITSSYLNMTNGLSLYGGFIEYRNTDIGFCKFSTMYGIDCMYVTAFTTSNEIEMQYCNFIKNTIKEPDEKNDLPALIFIIKDPFTISDCVFKMNIFRSGGRIAVMNTVTGVIPLVNCNVDLYSVNENDIIDTVNCDFSCGDQLITHNILFLNLGPCVGVKTVDPIPITKVFTPSLDFTPSFYFDATHSFSHSYIFTPSMQFSKSVFFTFSIYFSKSDEFTFSDIFSNSKKFAFSDMFSNSKKFTFSNMFSNSKKFTFSDMFSNSRKFTFSDMFSNSNFLPKTSSNAFSNSKVFTDSSHFTKSSLFTDSRSFAPTPSQSYISHKESITMILSQSFILQKSVTLTFTNSPSIYFTKCGNDECEQIAYIHTVFPYIIQFLSPTYISIKIVTDFVENKKKISPEQLIGVVCGSVAVFFIIIAITIIVLRKKNNLIAFNNSIDISASSSSSIRETQQVFENNIFNIKNTQEVIDDSWI